MCSRYTESLFRALLILDVQLMRGAAPYLSPLTVPQNTEPPTVVNLNVGGKSYATTSHTLLAAPNSFFWEILATGPQVRVLRSIK